MGKKCKCKIISFGHINLYLLLIPFGALFQAAKDIITSDSTKFGEKDRENQHPIIITINYAFGLCLSFIFFITYKICSKRGKTANIFLFEKIMYKPTPNKKINNKEKFLWILLGSIIDFIANIIYAYNWLDDEEDYLTYWSSNIIILCLFSFLLLKQKLYKHHYLSVGIIIIFGIANNINCIYFKRDKVNKNYKGYIIYFFIEITFNSLYVFYKFIMVKKFIKSFVILSFQGLIELILGIVTLVITTKWFKNFDNFFSYMEGLDYKEKLLFFVLILVNFIKNLTIYIIIEIFTPFHIFLLNIISDIILFFIDSDFYEEIDILISYIVYVVIVILMILIFIEIIQLNFCGLSTMTKKNIEERAKLDAILNDDNDDEEDKKEVNKEDNVRNSERKLFSIQGYSVELRELGNSIFPSDLDSFKN